MRTDAQLRYETRQFCLWNRSLRLAETSMRASLVLMNVDPELANRLGADNLDFMQAFQDALLAQMEMMQND